MTVMPALLQVSNVDQSIAFYTDVLGMQLIRKQDYPAGRFTLASLAYDDDVFSAIELSHNWGIDDGEVSNSGQIKLLVDDAIKVCDESKYAKGEVLRYLVDADQHGVEAVLKDPDGHIIQIVEKPH